MKIDKTLLILIFVVFCIASCIIPVSASESYPRTVTDMVGREVTLENPIERIIANNPDNARIVIALGDGDKLVGADECTVKYGCVCPMSSDSTLLCEDCWNCATSAGLQNLPVTNDRYNPNLEQMISLSPDLVFFWDSWEDKADDVGERVDTPVFIASPNFEYESMTEHIRVIGEVLDREEEAEELISFIDDELKKVTDITSNIPYDDQPRVYFAPRGAKNGFYDPKEGRDFTRTINTYEPLTMAGGINVAESVADGNVNVAIEEIIAWDPEVIFVACSSPDDAGVDFILEAPELQSIQAIKDKKVYNVFSPYCRGRPHDMSMINTLYMAKLLYPDKFSDLDLEKEGNAIKEAFLGVDGVFTDSMDYLQFPRTQVV